MDAKAKVVHLALSVEKQQLSQSTETADHDSNCVIHPCDQFDSDKEGTNCAARGGSRDLERVRVVLTADPGVSMDDTEDQEPPHRKEHRRVPSTIAFEEVKVGSATILCPYCQHICFSFF